LDKSHIITDIGILDSEETLQTSTSGSTGATGENSPDLDCQITISFSKETDKKSKDSIDVVGELLNLKPSIPSANLPAEDDKGQWTQV